MLRLTTIDKKTCVLRPTCAIYKYRSQVSSLPAELNLYSLVVVSGSGISIFVIQSRNPLNATMNLDGNVTTISSMDALPGAGNPLAYNVTLYTVQSLAAAGHTLDITLLDYVYPNGTTSKSNLRLDFAAVNETSPSVVSPSPSGAGGGTPTSFVPAPSGSTGTSHSQ